jgi:hypothetical protein
VASPSTRWGAARRPEPEGRSIPGASRPPRQGACQTGSPGSGSARHAAAPP